MDYSPSGSSVHGILCLGRILEWVAMPFSKGSSRPLSGLHLLNWGWFPVLQADSLLPSHQGSPQYGTVVAYRNACQMLMPKINLKTCLFFIWTLFNWEAKIQFYLKHTFRNIISHSNAIITQSLALGCCHYTARRMLDTKKALVSFALDEQLIRERCCSGAQLSSGHHT